MAKVVSEIIQALRKKQPWELTRKQYEQTQPLKAPDAMYVSVGDKKVEVLRNPTSNDSRAMTREATKKYGKPTNNDPVLRTTEDADGNRYQWPSYEALHMNIEPSLSRLEKATINQNAAQKPTHRGVVTRALYQGEKVPQDILDSYKGIKDEVRKIEGNKVLGATGAATLAVANAQYNQTEGQPLQAQSLADSLRTQTDLTPLPQPESQAIGIPQNQQKLHQAGTWLKQNLQSPLGGTWFENAGDYMTDFAEGQKKTPADAYLSSLLGVLDVTP